MIPKLRIQSHSLMLQRFPLLLLLLNHSKMAKSLNEHNGGLGCGVLGVRDSKGALGRRMRRLNRLQAPDLGFSSHRPNSPSHLGRLAELVTYSSTQIPLRLAESFLGLADSLLNLGFPLLSWLSKSWVLQLSPT